MSNKSLAPDGENQINASPTKSFFVDMLTRDIELRDAILDLLDNSLDGVLRTQQVKKPNTKSRDLPYDGYEARIWFGRDTFQISDNCGGISRDILQNYAFRLGRPDSIKDQNLATVGLYGIGMKRAIFKMGDSCTVTTRYKNTASEVTISPKWLKDDDNWKLDFKEIDHNSLSLGTTIIVTGLYDDIKSEFDIEKNREFVELFELTVSTHYSYIIQKGFKVFINDKPVRAKKINLQIDHNSSRKSRLAPFMYKGKIGNVDVDLVVGLYRDIPSPQELDKLDEGGRFRREEAGWTIICNDRVIVANDTSHVTGWGEGDVPKYHTQFIAISGVVRFTSNHPKELPLTTTKRGINLTSALYADVKNIMRQGLKHFTGFTNKWKIDPVGRKKVYSETVPVDPWAAMALVEEKDWKQSRKFGGDIFIPTLPIPKSKHDTDPEIRFRRSLSEVQLLGEYFFGDPTVKASLIGETCFEKYLKLAQSERY